MLSKNSGFSSTYSPPSRDEIRADNSSIVTRSGTNQWHGVAFDYLRNNFFDANNWFNDYDGLPEPPLRQNDFGGTLGGPVYIPGLYNGKNKTSSSFLTKGCA